jgi:hypothetical protein
MVQGPIQGEMNLIGQIAIFILLMYGARDALWKFNPSKSIECRRATPHRIIKAISGSGELLEAKDCFVFYCDGQMWIFGKCESPAAVAQRVFKGSAATS